MRRVDSLEKTLMLGIGGGRRRWWQRMRWLDGITDLMDMSLSELGVGDGQGGLACCNSWGLKESDTTEQLNWTELNWTFMKGTFHAKMGSIKNRNSMDLTEAEDITKRWQEYTELYKKIGKPWDTKELGLFITCMYLKSDSVQFSSVAQSCPTLCDPMNCSTPGLPVYHQLLEFTQTQSI